MRGFIAEAMKTTRFNVSAAVHGDPDFCHLGIHGGFPLVRSFHTLAKARKERAAIMRGLFAWNEKLTAWPLLVVRKQTL